MTETQIEGLNASEAQEQCAYCGEAGNEIEHVVAKQFFPAEGAYRGDLVRVPACGKCNREKQRVEDTAGVYIPFTGHGDASNQLLEGRIPRTLEKNLRLKRSIKLQERYRIDKTGKFKRILVIPLEEQVLSDLKEWFNFLVKGFYRHEFHKNLEKIDRIYLVWPRTPADIEFWRNFISERLGNMSIDKALGEINYAYAPGIDGISSAWVIRIYGVEIIAFTGTVEGSEVRTWLESVSW